MCQSRRQAMQQAIQHAGLTAEAVSGIAFISDMFLGHDDLSSTADKIIRSNIAHLGVSRTLISANWRDNDHVMQAIGVRLGVRRQLRKHMRDKVGELLGDVVCHYITARLDVDVSEHLGASDNVGDNLDLVATMLPNWDLSY